MAVFQVVVDGRVYKQLYSEEDVKLEVLNWLTSELAIDKNADQRIHVREYSSIRLMMWADVRRELAPYKIRPFKPSPRECRK